MEKDSQGNSNRMQDRKRYENNIKYLYLELLPLGPLFSIIGTFLSVYALRLGASNLLVSMLVSIPALVNIILPLPIAQLVSRHRGSIHPMAFSLFLYRLGFLVMALVPWFFLEGQAEAIIIINGIMTIPAVFVNLSFSAIFADIVPVKERARVVSNRLTILGIVTTVSVLLGGRLLEWIEFPLNFQILFLVAFAGSLISSWYVWRIDLSVSSFKKPAQPKAQPFWTMLGPMMRNKNFARFSISSFIFHWGLFLPAPLFSIYLVRNIGASDGWIAIIGTVSALTAAVVNTLWARLANMRGNRMVLLITVLGLVPHSVMFALTRQVELFIPVVIFVNFFVAGMNQSLYNVMLEVCPDDDRPSYIAAYSAAMNVAVFAAPLAGAWIAEQITIELAFIVAAVIRLASFISFIVLRPETPQAPADSGSAAVGHTADEAAVSSS